MVSAVIYVLVSIAVSYLIRSCCMKKRGPGYGGDPYGRNRNHAYDHPGRRQEYNGGFMDRQVAMRSNRNLAPYNAGYNNPYPGMMGNQVSPVNMMGSPQMAAAKGYPLYQSTVPSFYNSSVVL